jgi:GntR family transcriptional regulator/MocR family aminotransferase
MCADQTNQLTHSRRANPPLFVELDRAAEQPLFQQIYRSIRSAILSGRLVAGSQLPATRTLARDLHVARATVVLAFEQLTTEGFIQGRGAAGTFVSALSFPRAAAPRVGSTEKSPTVVTSSHSRPSEPAASRPFRLGEPALELFPARVWNRLHARRARASGYRLLGYGRGNGYLPLRRAIGEYTAASRGVLASTEQVVLCRGAQQAIDLATKALIRPGDTVWLEDPGYPPARRVFESGGAMVAPVPVDENGLIVDAGIRAAPHARLAYVAPSHQFPLGSAMSLERRLALLDWAAHAKAWIVEDDYDSEFRYPGRPLASLQGLDRAGRVLYLGTFSKTVFPALRLGYLIVPNDLIDRFIEARAIADHMAPTVEQAALADFIDQGHFTRHLRRMRDAYGERQEALLVAAQRETSDLMTVEPADAGMHAIGWLRDALDDVQASRSALEHGVEAPALSSYCLRTRLAPALLLGFSSVPPRGIPSALRKLHAAVANASRGLPKA